MSRRTSEQYVRPPVVASEPPSPALAAWRFRLISGLLLLVVIAGFVWLMLHFLHPTGGSDPGLIGSLRAPAATVAATAG